MTENGLLDDAVRFLEQGRFREAEEIYWRILQSDPNHAGALHMLGVVRHLQGDHEAAIKLIGRAIELNPVNAVYRNNYGLPLHSLDRFAEALDSFRRALEINPRYAQAMANLGMAQQSLGQHEAAMASFREALKLEPYHADALIKLAELLEKLGRHEEAIELSQSGIISSVVVQPNNQILLGGMSGGYPSVVRLNVDGSLDSTFGSDGIVTDESSAGWLDDLLVQSNGRILVAGGQGGNPLLAQYYAGDVAGTQVNVVSSSPALTLSGSGTAIAGNTYTLTLGGGRSYLGSGSDIAYDIAWGDSTPDTIVSADALAAQQNQVSHVFNATTDGVTVNLDVDGSTYSDISGSAFAVAVDMTDATTTSLAFSPSSPTFGQTVTLTATVSASSGAGSGTVEFYDGTMDLGSGTLLVTGGYDVASLVTPPLALGDHAFTAVYGGDGTFSPSNSAVTVKAVTSGMLGWLSLTGSSTATAGATYDLTLPTTDSADDTITQWWINWGDGSSDTLSGSDTMSSDTHVYQSPGDYLVQAVATASDGNSPAMLDIDATPAAEWSASDLSGAIADIAVQPDGSIVAIQNVTGSQPANSLIRYTASGQNDGTAFDDLSASIPTITAVTIQPETSPLPLGEGPGVRAFDILAAGEAPSSPGNGPYFNIARFNSDGSLDTTFGGNGIASAPLPLGQGGDVQMLVEPDGDIVLAGIEPDSGGGGDDDLVLARFTSGGQLNTTFGSSGIETYDLSAAATSVSVAAQPGGYIVAAVGLSGSTEVLRFNADGSQDTAFGSSGVVTSMAIVSDPLLAIQPAGQIDVAGGNGSGGFALLQYTAGGTSDWSVTSAGTGTAAAMAIQPGGRIVVAVDDVMGSTHTWSLNGFSEAGSADSAFDGLGSISGLTGGAVALGVAPNGDILLAGQGASDAFFAQYGAGGPAVSVTEPDVTITDLSVTASAATYSGADTEEGGSASPAQIEVSFTDPGTVKEAHNISIAWGGGLPDATFTLAAAQTSFDYPLPQYAANGAYDISVTVTNLDGSGSVSTTESRLAVNYTNSQPSALSLSLDESTISVGDQLTLSGSFTDPQVSVAHLVTIDWGDGGGTPDVTTLSLGPGETTFQASPNSDSYSATGSYAISVTVAGLDGSTEASTTVTVVPVLPEVMVGSEIPVVSDSSGGDGEFLVTRVNGSSNSDSLTIYYQIAGTAQSGTDYSITDGSGDALDGSVTIPAGETSATIEIVPVDEVGASGSQIVTLTLSAGTGYNVASAFSTARVTIDDGGGSFASGDGVGATGALNGPISGSLWLYNADGTVNTSGSALLGETMPMVANVEGNTTDENFYFEYDSSEITVSTSPGGAAIPPETYLSSTPSDTTYYVSAADPGADVAVSGYVSMWEVDRISRGYICDVNANFDAYHMNMTGVTIQDHIDETPATVKVGQRIELEVVSVGPNGGEARPLNRRI